MYNDKTKDTDPRLFKCVCLERLMWSVCLCMPRDIYIDKQIERYIDRQIDRWMGGQIEIDRPDLT